MFCFLKKSFSVLVLISFIFQNLLPASLAVAADADLLNEQRYWRNYQTARSEGRVKTAPEYLFSLCNMEEATSLEDLIDRKSAILYFFATGGKNGFRKKPMTLEERTTCCGVLAFVSLVHEIESRDETLDILDVRRSYRRLSETAAEINHLIIAQEVMDHSSIRIQSSMAYLERTNEHQNIRQSIAQQFISKENNSSSSGGKATRSSLAFRMPKATGSNPLDRASSVIEGMAQNVSTINKGFQAKDGIVDLVQNGDPTKLLMMGAEQFANFEYTNRNQNSTHYQSMDVPNVINWGHATFHNVDVHLKGHNTFQSMQGNIKNLTSEPLEQRTHNSMNMSSQTYSGNPISGNIGYRENRLHHESDTNILKNSILRIEKRVNLAVDTVDAYGLKITGGQNLTGTLDVKKMTLRPGVSTEQSQTKQSHLSANYNVYTKTPSLNFGSETTTVNKEWVQEHAELDLGPNVKVTAGELHTQNSAKTGGDITAQVRTHHDHQEINEVKGKYNKVGSALRLVNAANNMAQATGELAGNLNKTFATNQTEQQQDYEEWEIQNAQKKKATLEKEKANSKTSKQRSDVSDKKKTVSKSQADNLCVKVLYENSNNPLNPYEKHYGYGNTSQRKLEKKDIQVRQDDSPTTVRLKQNVATYQEAIEKEQRLRNSKDISILDDLASRYREHALRQELGDAAQLYQGNEIIKSTKTIAKGEGTSQDVQNVAMLGMTLTTQKMMSKAGNAQGSKGFQLPPKVTTPRQPSNYGADSAKNVALYERYKNHQLIAEQISQGHAFEKHVVSNGEFPGWIRTRHQLRKHIEGVLSDPLTNKISIGDGKTLHIHEPSHTVVLHNPKAVDGGTVFQPEKSIEAFLKKRGWE